MQMESGRKKVVLAIAGHDPSGAAGIQADIETIAAAGCQCISLITALTIQNTSEFLDLIPQQTEQFRQQCLTLLSDIDVDACKIGLIGNLSIAEIITEILDQLNDVPVVYDPVMNAGVGKSLATEELTAYVSRELLRRADVLTPNCSEARQLTGHEDIYEAGKQLVASGCQHVLVTGADEDTAQVCNILFQGQAEPVHYDWERLAGMYHGSGCTLSSAIAAYLANGMEPITAIETAQEFTWKSLKNGRRYGLNQIHPDRFYSN